MGTVLSVDESRCTGHGRCYSVAPKLLSDDDEGFPPEWRLISCLASESRITSVAPS